MPNPKKKRKPKKEDAAPTGAEGGRDALALADSEDIHVLMSLNGPKVAKWAFDCVNRAARGRASLFQQKVALLMIQKCTPSTGRKAEEEDELLEGASKEELHTLDRLISQARKDVETQSPPTGTRTAGPAGAREAQATQVGE